MEIPAIVDSLSTLLEKEGEKAFESKGAVLLHKALADHEALRDPEFWYWFATVPGRTLVENRYPFKEKAQVDLELEDNERKAPNYLPGRNNFVGQHAKEVLFFRLQPNRFPVASLMLCEDKPSFPDMLTTEQNQVRRRCPV